MSISDLKVAFAELDVDGDGELTLNKELGRSAGKARGRGVLGWLPTSPEPAFRGHRKTDSVKTPAKPFKPFNMEREAHIEEENKRQEEADWKAWMNEAKVPCVHQPTHVDRSAFKPWRNALNAPDPNLDPGRPDPNKMASAKEILKLLDLDGDGNVTIEEVMAADTDGDGQLSAEEIQAAIEKGKAAKAGAKMGAKAAMTGGKKAVEETPEKPKAAPKVKEEPEDSSPTQLVQWLNVSSGRIPAYRPPKPVERSPLEACIRCMLCVSAEHKHARHQYSGYST